MHYQSDDSSCYHNFQNSEDQLTNCTRCGICAQGSVVAIKTRKYQCPQPTPPALIIHSLLLKSHSKFKTQRITIQPYLNIRHNVIDYILKIADRFTFGLQTISLAVYLLDTLIQKEPKLFSLIHLYASVCLLISAKAVQIDKKIPFLTKLRKYSAFQHTISEFKKVQYAILYFYDYDLQIPTFAQLLSLMMNQGVLFQNEIKKTEDVAYIQEESLKTGYKVIKEKFYSQIQPAIMAVGIVTAVRRFRGYKPYHRCIEKYMKIQYSKVQSTSQYIFQRILKEPVLRESDQNKWNINLKRPKFSSFYETYKNNKYFLDQNNNLVNNKEQHH